VAFAAGAYEGANHDPAASDRALVQRFVNRWERGDYAGMHRLIDPRTRARVTVAAFGQAYRDAAATATATAFVPGRVGRRRGNVIDVPMTVQTRAFGAVRAVARIRLTGDADAARVAWSPALTFPGVRRGERLQRRTRLPARAALLARDRTPLARGPGRTSGVPDVAAQVVGQLGPPPPDQVGALKAAGFPPDAPVGTSGLERVFNSALAGTPGGELLAGERTLASRVPKPGRAVRTTIDIDTERAAVTALAGRPGGVAVVQPRTGEVLALAGTAFSVLQPPGSTFKIVTATAALEARLVKPSTQFPVETAAVLDGVRLENANGERCGGSFANAFAQSCNSVFAPLGARIGARRLVDAARRFGFNEPPPIAGAQTSSIPEAADVGGGELAIGSTAIGQGRVVATTLQMALVAAAIGDGGLRVRPTLRYGERTRRTRVTSRRVARQVARLMLGVVRFGTGTAAAVPGVQIAGKTGTAELEDAPKPTAPGELPPPPDPNAPPRTDAWFVAYGPARRPRVAVSVLLIRGGAGRTTAAPAARGVLIAALKRRIR